MDSEESNRRKTLPMFVISAITFGREVQRELSKQAMRVTALKVMIHRLQMALEDSLYRKLKAGLTEQAFDQSPPCTASVWMLGARIRRVGDTGTIYKMPRLT